MIVLQLHLPRKRGASRSEMIGFFVVCQGVRCSAALDFSVEFIILKLQKTKSNLMKKLLVIGVLFLSQSLFAQKSDFTLGSTLGKNESVGKYLKTRGINLYYEIYGKGEPLLFIHGNGGSMRAFRNQIDFFAKKYKVICVDSRAQGKSIDTSSVLNYNMMADDFNALLDTLKIDSANVIGWSDGGINGLLLAIKHPKKVRKLAITGANLVPDTSVFTSYNNEMNESDLARLRAQKQDFKTKNAIKVIHMMQVEPHISLSDLKSIQCPVLVIGGDNDLIKSSHTLQIYENISRAYLWIMPFSGHATPQRRKEEFNTKVFEFLITPYHKVVQDDWDK
jgi:pimeloyl-ACP methyl ester carboxylesterase